MPGRAPASKKSLIHRWMHGKFSEVQAIDDVFAMDFLDSLVRQGNMFHRAENDTRKDMEEALRTALEKERNIVFAYIFGSFIEDIPFRDIDVGIYLNNIDISSFTGVELELSNRMVQALPKAIPVDVRVINRAPLPFRFSVIRGQLLFSRADDVLEEFIVTTARQYLDFAPLRKRYIREALTL